MTELSILLICLRKSETLLAFVRYQSSLELWYNQWC